MGRLGPGTRLPSYLADLRSTQIHSTLTTQITGPPDCLQMEPSKRSYFFVPLNSPLAGPTALGSLIADPKFANLPLNQTPHALEDRDIIKPPAVSDWYLRTGRTRGGGGGIFVDFLAPILGIGGNAAVDANTTVESEIGCDLLETRYFIPRNEYIKKSIEDGDVKNWMAQHKPWRRHSKFYIITGIKIAHNASVATKIIKERGINFHFGLDGTNSGVPITLGPELNIRRDNTREEGFTVVEPFVIAYQLHEVAVKLKTTEVTTNEPYTDGAALGVVCDTDDGDVEVIPEVVAGDVGAGEFGSTDEGRAHRDETDTNCWFSHS